MEKSEKIVTPVLTGVTTKNIFNPALALVGHCTNLAQVAESKKNINYVMGQDGAVYEIRKTPVGTFTLKTNKVLAADTINEGFQWSLPKIPFDILLEIVSFFKAVCEEFKDDESMIQIFYNKKENKYFNVCLKQSTSKVSVFFERNTELESNDDYQLVMDIHSHNTMDAFFSGTDDSDEKETRLFGVFGKLKNKIPAFKFRMGVAGRFKELNIGDIFELPQYFMKIGDTEYPIPVDESNLIFPETDFPEEWLEIIREGKQNLYKFRPAASTIDYVIKDAVNYTPSSLFDKEVNEDETVFEEDFEDSVEELGDAVCSLGALEFGSFIEYLINQGLETQLVDTLTDYGIKLLS